MKEIPLTQGQVALVDDSDYGMVSGYRWCAIFNKYTKSFYAYANTTVDGTKTTVAMHRIVACAKKGEFVDHDNHQTLDNRRSNLKVTTRFGNGKNLRLKTSNTSGFCGVHWCKNNNKWRAIITVDGARLHLGVFEDKADAIAARKQANIKYGFHENHGEALEKDIQCHNIIKNKCRNMRLKVNNKSGFCGVALDKRRGMWNARITVKGKEVYLGSYVKKADAIAARQAANIKYGFHENHGKAFDWRLSK